MYIEIKTARIKPVCYTHLSIKPIRGYYWFRVFGFGLHVKDTRKNPLLPSERYGHMKRIQIGRFSIRLLTPRS